MSGGYISQKIEDEVLCFGIAFYKKRCIVKKNRVLEVPRLLAVIKTDDWGTFLKSYFVADVKITTIFNKDTAMFSVFRLIILPAAALVVGLGLDATSLGISVLMTPACLPELRRRSLRQDMTVTPCLQRDAWL